MHYVALSRLRSISGLHILNLNENKISVSKKVQEEMQRLRNKALLQSHPPFLYKDTSQAFKILFHNVRLLYLHHVIGIIKSSFYKNIDISCLHVIITDVNKQLMSIFL